MMVISFCGFAKRLTNERLSPTNCFSLFDHFAEFALRVLKTSNELDLTLHRI